MYLVAVSGMSPSVDENARLLATALGKTAYETRSRASVPHGGPTIVATFGALAPAEAVATTLRAAGLRVLMDTPEGLAGRWQSTVGRSVAFVGDEVIVEDRLANAHRIPAGRVDLILAGVGLWEQSHEETQTARKFSAGRAIVSGGLMLTKKQTTTTVSTTKGGDRYLGVYVGPRCYLLTETELQYTGLGDLMQASRAANFITVNREIRARNPAAIYDDRLQTRPGQLQLLGPSFSPEAYGELAAAVLANTLIG